MFYIKCFDSRRVKSFDDWLIEWTLRKPADKTVSFNFLRIKIETIISYTLWETVSIELCVNEVAHHLIQEIELLLTQISRIALTTVCDCNSNKY